MESMIPTRRSAAEIDTHVGKMLRAFRKSKGMSQEALAEALGLTFQQIQKYERGANRISASKMFAAANCLGVAPAAFFEGLPEVSESTMPAHFAEFFALSDASELAANYLKLSPSKRKVVASMIATMAD